MNPVKYLAAALIVAAAAAFPAAAQPVAPVNAAVKLELPAPTGRFRIAVTELRLADAARADPFAPGKPRELMVSIWYPAASGGARPQAAYMRPGAAKVVAEALLKPMGLDPA